MRLRPQSDGLVLDDTWLWFHTPTDHLQFDSWGGAMLGLGLSGHLGHQHRMQVLHLLTTAHDLLSIGTLLGTYAPCASLSTLSRLFVAHRDEDTATLGGEGGGGRGRTQQSAGGQRRW